LGFGPLAQLVERRHSKFPLFQTWVLLPPLSRKKMSSNEKKIKLSEDEKLLEDEKNLKLKLMEDEKKLAEDETHLLMALDASDAEEKKKMASNNVPPPPDTTPDTTMWDQVGSNDENGNLVVQNRGTGDTRTIRVIPGDVPQYIWLLPPVIQQPPPVIQQLPPVIQQPPPVIQQLPPVIQQPPPVIQQPPPVIQQPPPVIQQPPPVIQQLPPVIQQPPPVIQQPPPVIQQPPPVIQQPPPVLQLPLTQSLLSQPSGSTLPPGTLPPVIQPGSSNVIHIGDPTQRITRHAIILSNPEIAPFVFELLDRVKELESKVVDLSRWIKKRHFVLYGDDVPVETKHEDPTSIFIRLTTRKFGVRTSPNDYGMIHRLGTNGIIAEVINRKLNSPFMKLMSARDQNPNLDIKLGMKKSAEDWEMFRVAENMLRSGTISNYFQDHISGKIVVVKHGRYIPINEVREMLHLD
jgi:hypothetical protein